MRVLGGLLLVAGLIVLVQALHTLDDPRA